METNLAISWKLSLSAPTPTTFSVTKHATSSGLRELSQPNHVGSLVFNRGEGTIRQCLICQGVGVQPSSGLVSPQVFIALWFSQKSSFDLPLALPQIESCNDRVKKLSP